VEEPPLQGLPGVYLDQGPVFQAVSYIEAERAEALKYAEEAFAEYADFTEKYPGIDIGPLACAVGRDFRTGKWLGPPSRLFGGLAAPADRTYGWLCDPRRLSRCWRYDCTDEELLYDRRYVHCERNKLRAMAFLWTRQAGRCGWCGEPLASNLGYAPVSLDPKNALVPEIDHIVPRGRGGPDIPDNTQLVHRRCNHQKHMKMTAQAEELAILFTLAGEMTPLPTGQPEPGTKSRGQCPECGRVVTGRRKYTPHGWTSLRRHQPPSGMESCLSVCGTVRAPTGLSLWSWTGD
jgi:5-methylcytosine-specific restriction endonuclease McrA